MFKKLALGSAIMILGSFTALPAAHAGVSIGIGGDSNWGITATTRTSDTYLRPGRTLTASTSITYRAHVLGIPIPVTGYYHLAIPQSGGFYNYAPTLVSYNSSLTSRTFAINHGRYTGTREWYVEGSTTFWGTKTVDLKATVRSSHAGSGGYVHGGSGFGHWIDANAAQYVRSVW